MKQKRRIRLIAFLLVVVLVQAACLGGNNAANNNEAAADAPAEPTQPPPPTPTPEPDLGPDAEIFANKNNIKDIEIIGDTAWMATLGGVVVWDMSTGDYWEYTPLDGLNSTGMFQSSVSRTQASTSGPLVSGRFQSMISRSNVSRRSAS